MHKNLQWKALAIVIVTVLAVWSFTPPSERILLGLDLKGGIQLVLRVETDEALTSETDTVRDQLQEAAKTAGIPVTAVRTVSPTVFEIDGVPPASSTQFGQLAEKTTGANFDREAVGDGKYRFTMRINIAANRRTEAVRQALLTIERRVNEFGVAEPVVAPYGTTGSQILVQLPGMQDVNRAKSIVRQTARLEIKLVESGPSPDEKTLLASRNGVVPDDMEVVYGSSQTGLSTRDAYLVRKTATIAGTDLRTARPTVDEFNQPAVAFTLSRDGSEKFAKATGENVGRLLAIILDDVVVSAPSIKERISTTEARITGVGRQEADDLALVLRSGALPASLTTLQQQEIGASLGQDSIRAGIIASLLGLGFVAVFMLMYYKLAGINAILTVALNLVILLGFMSYIGAVMTLPGIAGFILTIGIGVDSNVLIFERIREELESGKGARQALGAGFDRVFLTILDTHIASLISAAFLFQFGTGPIRGFATTLFFGLLSNVFTAVFVSRTLFEFLLSRKPATAKLSI
jgi:preprotein translocase subunit SecD